MNTDTRLLILRADCSGRQYLEAPPDKSQQLLLEKLLCVLWCMQAKCSRGGVQGASEHQGAWGYYSREPVPGAHHWCAVAHSLVARASLLTETRRGAGLG